MKPHNDEQKSAEGRNKPGQPRFRIEKLEERIAPAKGGTPGKPPYHYPPGQHCYYGICCPNGHHGCRI
jgi:hypothetical protein